ncbi:MAG: hypothetical protein ACRCYO_00755 [Bacteroidia bacterium]
MASKIGIFFLFLLLASCALIPWYLKRQDKAREEWAIEWNKEREISNEKNRLNYPKNKKVLDDFFVRIGQIYTDIKRIDADSLFIKRGEMDAYKSWLQEETRDAQLNFNFFPYEVMYAVAHNFQNDTKHLQMSWPWIEIMPSKWSSFTYNDTNFAKDMRERLDMMSSMAFQAENIESFGEQRYLHIMCRMKDNELDLLEKDKAKFNFDDQDNSGIDGNYKGEAFIGCLIIYDLKNNAFVAALPLTFGSSEKLRFEASKGDFFAQKAFREAFVKDLKENFNRAFIQLASDSLDLSDTKFSNH